jgi:hypothetical protein
LEKEDLRVGEGDGFEGTREEMERAIRRLSVLEHIIVVAAFALALAGGWAVAFLLRDGTPLPFRLTWAVISLLLLLIPAALVFGRDRAKGEGESTGSIEGDDG